MQFDQNLCARKTKTNPHTYNLKKLIEIAKSRNIYNKDFFTNKTVACSYLKRMLVNSASIHRQLSPIIFPSNHPLFSQPKIVKSIVTKLSSGEKLSLTETTYYRKNIILITRLFDNIAQYIMQYQMNNPIIKTNGLKAPKKKWIPNVGNANANNNINFHNNVFLAGDIPNRSKMVYLENNLEKGKIKKVYNLNHLKTWLLQKKESPISRKKIKSWNSLKFVPKKIIDKYVDIVELAIVDAKYLNNMFSTPIITRALRFLKHTNFSTIKTINSCHVKNQTQFVHLKRTCSVYVSMLRDYIDSKKNKMNLLKELGDLIPVCIENLCISIREFINKNEYNFDFDFDSQTSMFVNISNCANAYRNYFCTLYNKKEITLEKFFTKMKHIQTTVFTHLKNKKATDGFIKLTDVYNFLIEYGHMLLECNNVKFPPSFKLMLSKSKLYSED